MPWYKLNYGDNIFTTNLYLEYMKKIYSLLFVALFLFLGYSCDDGSLDHSDVLSRNQLKKILTMTGLHRNLQLPLL